MTDPGGAWEYPPKQGAPDAPSPTTPPTVRHELGEAVHEVTHPGSPLTEGRSRVADDLLLLFGRLAAATLFSIVLLTGLLAAFQPEKDLSGVYNLLNTQLSLIIGAVLGYAAHPTEKD